MSSEVGLQQCVFVTGGSGFIGSHLIRELARRGTPVIAWLRKPVELPAGVTPLIAEQTPAAQLEQLRSAFRQYSPQTVYHLATHFAGVHGDTDLLPLIESNVLFGTLLCEAMREIPQARLVSAGTIWQHYEGAEYSPVSLYAATKQAFEDIAKFYQEVHGLDLVTLKLFDSYGPQDPRKKLLHILKSAALSGESLEFSPGEQWIDLTYVSDSVRAFLRAADVGAVASGEYVVASGQALQVKDVIAAYAKVLGREIPVKLGARAYRPREMFTPWKYGTPLPGWRAEISLEEGLKKLESENR